MHTDAPSENWLELPAAITPPGIAARICAPAQATRAAGDFRGVRGRLVLARHIHWGDIFYQYIPGSLGDSPALHSKTYFRHCHFVRSGIAARRIMRTLPARPSLPVGIIMSGGGARVAYQVGVLRAIAAILPRGAANPFAIICGTSAGAINATSLASNADRFAAGVALLVRSGRTCISATFTEPI